VPGDGLGPPVVEQGYQIEPPRGFVFKRLRSPMPQFKDETLQWTSRPMPEDGTVAKARLHIHQLREVRTPEYWIDVIWGKAGEGPRHWRSPAERVLINGIPFARVRMRHRANPDEFTVQKDFIRHEVAYVAVDGPNRIMLTLHDVEPYHTSSFGLLETSVRTFRRR
jgi:hypothetical protein